MQYFVIYNNKIEVIDYRRFYVCCFVIFVSLHFMVSDENFLKWMFYEYCNLFASMFIANDAALHNSNIFIITRNCAIYVIILLILETTIGLNNNMVTLLDSNIPVMHDIRKIKLG